MQFVQKFILLLTLVILTSGQTNLFATTFYASPNGTGSGTIDSTCSFTVGLTKLMAAGDTLYLRGGIYNLNAKAGITKNGSSSARIAIMAYPGEKPILDFSSEPYGSSYPGISLGATSTYMHIKGLVVRYAGDNGIINNGSHHIIENCEFYGNCDTGLQHKVGGNNLILNCDSHHNFDYQSGGITLANFGGNADGFADKQFTNAAPNEYIGCRAWANSDDGWDFYERVGNNKIENCICYQNGPPMYDMTNHPRYLTDKAWFDQFPLTVKDADGGVGTIMLAAYTNYGNGNGFKLGGNFTAHNVTVTHCLAVRNTVRGFDQNNNYGTMTLTNNSAYLNAYNYGFGTGSGGTLIIKNCVSLNSINNNALASKSVTDLNNSWNKSGILCDANDFVSLDTTLVLSPRKADGSLSTVFMNLVPGSDLIDAGILAAIEYAGNAPDMGYHEAGVIDKFPPVVAVPSNTVQTILIGNPIADIVFSWSGGATGLTVANLPNGVSAISNDTDKTLTIHGTPAAIGNYSYTVTSVCSSDVPIVVSGSINVVSPFAKRIAYFTNLPVSAGDAVIIDKIKSNPDFSVVPVDATSATYDYSGFDLVVMSPVPASTSAGFTALENLSKPKLLLKPFTLKNTVWSWISGSAVNTTQLNATITDKAHPIFNGLTYSGTNSDELKLYTASGTAAVTGVTDSTWLAQPKVALLGNVTGTNKTNSIVEVPVGTNMNGTVTAKRFVMIGLSEYSLTYLTPAATQLIQNTCYYLLGLDVPLSVKKQEAVKKYHLAEYNNTLYVLNSGNEIQHMSLYSLLGTSLGNAYDADQISTSGLSTGLYIVVIKDKSGVHAQRFFKKN